MANIIEFIVKGKDEASAAFSSFTSTMTKASVAAAAAATAVGYLTVKTLDSIESVERMRRTIGVTRETMGGLRVMSALTGSSLSEVSTAARTLGRTVNDFVTNPSGESAEAFRKLGISQDQLQPIMNDTGAVMALVAERLSTMEDGLTKNQIASQLLGRSGAALASTWDDGAESFKKAAEEAQIFGLVLGEGSAKAADQAGDAIDRLGLIMTGMREQLVSALSPAISTIIEYFIDWQKETVKSQGGIESFAQNVATLIIDVAEKVALSVAFVVDAFRGLQVIFKLIQIAAYGVALGFSSLVLKLTEGAEKLANKFQQMRQFLLDFKAAFTGMSAEHLPKIDFGVEKGQEQLDRLAGSIKTISEELDSLLMKPLASSVVKETIGDLRIKIDEATAAMQRLNEETKKSSEGGVDPAAAEAARERRIKSLAAEFDLISANLSKQEEAEFALMRINALWQSGHVSVEAYTEQVKAIAGVYSEVSEEEQKRLDNLQAEFDLLQANRSSIEVANDQIAVYNSLWQGNLMTTEAYVEKVRELAGVYNEELNPAINQYFYATLNAFEVAGQALDTFADGIAEVALGTQSFAEVIRNTFEGVVKSVISYLVKIGLQRVILGVLLKSQSASQGATEMAQGLAQTYVNAFKSTAAIPIVGPALAPGVAAASVAAASAGATAAGAAGGALGAGIVGSFATGTNFIPRTGLAMVHKGERVVDAEKNKDLTSFLQQGESGNRPVTIEAINFSVSGDRLAEMSVDQIKEFVAQKIFPAMQKLADEGLMVRT